jgi:hypothetical protein
MHLGHAQYLPVVPPMFALLAGALVLLLILIAAFSHPLFRGRERTRTVIGCLRTGQPENSGLEQTELPI